MNRFVIPLLSVALLAACGGDAENTPVAEPAAPAAVEDAAAASTEAGGMAGAPAAIAASATGTVESVDAAGGRIVIAHEPVEALNWPAMTMGFAATPEQMQAVQPGQRVTFDFDSQGPTNTITRIEPAQ